MTNVAHRLIATMNRTPPTEAKSIGLPLDLAGRIKDLQGYFELGMAKEALQAARDLLRRRPVYPYAFTEAPWPIFVFADLRQPWKRLVETAYAQASSRTKKSLRPHMLEFYTSISDYESACRYLSPRPQTVEEVVSSMRTLLNLKKVEQALPLCRKCGNLLLQPHDQLDHSMLLDALADYHAQTGDLNTAETYWRLVPPEDPLFEKAARALVEIQAVRGHASVAAGRAALERVRAQLGGFVDLVRPGTVKESRENVRRHLQRYSAAFSRIVPEKDLWRFGREKLASLP